MAPHQNDYSFDLGSIEVTATLRYWIDWEASPAPAIEDVEIVSVRGVTDHVKDPCVRTRIQMMIPAIHDQMVEDAVDFLVGIHERRDETRMEFGMAD